MRPRGMGPFAALLSQYICLGNFLNFHKGPADDIACKLLIGGGELNEHDGKDTMRNAG